jgi:hypothetical protein
VLCVAAGAAQFFTPLDIEDGNGNGAGATAQGVPIESRFCSHNIGNSRRAYPAQKELVQQEL